MLTRCLFCHRAFPLNGRFARLPVGRRLAYEPGEGRLWVVCEDCHRWTLWPVEDRADALYELERAVHDSATPVTHTENISLFLLDDVLLVRVGTAGLAERAWWRYGRALRERKRSFEGPVARLTAYTFGALHLAGEMVGFADRDVDITWDDAPMADILRWRRFGWAAWHGRRDCPYCGSTLRALRYDMTWWIHPLRAADGSLEVGVPCQRCDPWTPDNLYVIDGPRAENVLRRSLAYQNIGGAGEQAIRDAARAIEASGSAAAFADDAASQRQSLWKLGRTRGIALEIALSETVERRLLHMGARALEFLWKQEEELARIIDEELTARRVLEKHLRRLPIRLGPRREPR